MLTLKTLREDPELVIRKLAKKHFDARESELLDKQRVLAVTKCDIIDETMMQQLQEHLPKDVECIFISAVTGYHIPELKDLLFNKLNADV